MLAIHEIKKNVCQIAALQITTVYISDRDKNRVCCSARIVAPANR